MKEQAMNLMLAVVRTLRSKGDSTRTIDLKMKRAMRAYDRGDYVAAIERASEVC